MKDEERELEEIASIMFFVKFTHVRENINKIWFSPHLFVTLHPTYHCTKQ